MGQLRAKASRAASEKVSQCEKSIRIKNLQDWASTIMLKGVKLTQLTTSIVVSRVKRLAR